MTTAGEATGASVAVLVKGWPRLSETFIAQEVLGLERLGLRQRIYALRHPTDRHVHELNRRVQAPVVYLPEYLHDAPRRVWAGINAARRLPGWGTALRVWAADWRRDPTRNRLRRFGQACVLGAELPADVAWLHAHFLHTPASVARYAALLTGRGWSFSAHAKDIWTSPDWEKREKLASAAWGVTCTRDGWRHLQGLAADPQQIGLVYHGLDFARFGDPPAARPPRDGGDAADPVRLLSVGRAVAKKGFDGLLTALARLPPGLAWRWEHIGGGERLAALQAQAAALGLGEDRVIWRGALTQDAVIEACRRADLFILPVRVADDGDRDGLPNVLMEAQALGLPCLSTPVGGVAELIDDGVTGALVPPDDPAALAAALVRLMTDPVERARLGAAGLARVRGHFSCHDGVSRLAARFFASIGGVEPTGAD